jgi:fructose-1,6-bisphosphatase II
MNSSCDLSPNLGLELVRATEAAALAAARWSGLGRLEEAEHAATAAMTEVLRGIAFAGVVCMGEEGRLGTGATFPTGELLGMGHGPAVDLLVDALEGRRLLAGSYPGALSAIGVAPRGRIWSPRCVRYMDKIVVNAEVAPVLTPECLDAPAAWTLALVARAKGKPVRDLVVFILDRPRHADLVAEIRAAGSHVLLRSGGDLLGALMACLRDGKVDLLMGSGGVPQGLLAACAVKATRGDMLARLTAQNPEEAETLRRADPDVLRIRSAGELVSGQCAFFVVTGITDSPLLNGVRYFGPRAESSSIILRAETGIRRTILTEHWVGG